MFVLPIDAAAQGLRLQAVVVHAEDGLGAADVAVKDGVVVEVADTPVEAYVAMALQTTCFAVSTIKNPVDARRRMSETIESFFSLICKATCSITLAGET